MLPLQEWYALYPLLKMDSPYPITLPYHLNDNISIIKAPDWLRKYDFHQSLHPNLLNSIFYSDYYFVEYRFQASALYEENSDSKKLFIFEVIDIIDYLNYSLWIKSYLSSSPYPYIYFALKEKDIFKIGHIENYKKPKEYNSDIDDIPCPSTEVEYISNIFQKIIKLDQKSSIWLSREFVLHAIKELSFAVRFSFLWMALESLFGADSELTFRISQRMALFLSNDIEIRNSLFKEITDSYRLRSKIVHGKTFDPTDNKAFDFMFKTEKWFKDATCKILMDDKLIKEFNSKNREKFLDNLAFQ